MDPKILPIAYIIGLVVYAVIQDRHQKWFAENSIWERNTDWQSEISSWAWAMVIVLVGVVRSSSDDIIHAHLALFILSCSLFIRHFKALMKDKSKVAHRLGASANLFGMFLFLLEIFSWLKEGFEKL